MILALSRMLKPITLPKLPLAKSSGRKIDPWCAPKYSAEAATATSQPKGHRDHTIFRGLSPEKKFKKPSVVQFK
jgi:hypothetical protein